MSPRERDDDSGQFSEQYERGDFLAAIRELETPTTAAIAEEVGCSYDLAYRRLRGLEKEGETRVLEVGNSLLWHLEQ